MIVGPEGTSFGIEREVKVGSNRYLSEKLV